MLDSWGTDGCLDPFGMGTGAGEWVWGPSLVCCCISDILGSVSSFQPHYFCLTQAQPLLSALF